MTDVQTSTDDSGIDQVAPGGVTKAEVVNSAAAVDPTLRSGVTDENAEPTVESDYDRREKAGETAPILSNAPQDVIEKNNAEARQDQFDAWKNPETLAEQQDEIVDLLHDGDFSPGGRFSPEAENADYFKGTEQTNDPVAAAVEEEQKAREEGAQQTAQALEDQGDTDPGLPDATTQPSSGPTGATGAEGQAASTGEVVDETNPAANDETSGSGSDTPEQ